MLVHEFATAQELKVLFRSSLRVQMYDRQKCMALDILYLEDRRKF
jgi:hypothetical protein